jgi:hypothetical protein
MPIKINYTSIILLALMMHGLLSACSNPAPAATPPKEPPVPADRVDVIYFYSAEDCACGVVVGNQISSTLFFDFSEDLNSGKLTFQSLDLDDEKNAIIASKYGATSISLFMNIATADAEYVIAVPEISLVKDDEDAVVRLVTARTRQALDGEK